MRTFAARQNDLKTNRYSDTDLMQHETGMTVESARAILVSAGGRKAAKRAIAQLYATSKAHREGWLASAALNAPVRVLQALILTGVVEQNQTVNINEIDAEDYMRADKDWVWKFRLTELGKHIGREKEKTKQV